MATKIVFYEECDICKRATGIRADRKTHLDKLLQEKWVFLTQPTRSVCGACVAKMTKEERLILGIAEEKKT